LQIFWSLAAIGAVLAIIFILTREPPENHP